MIKIVVAVKLNQGEIGPFDGAALECALSTKNARITVVSMSPLSSLAQAEYITRLGAEETILISDEAFKGSDTLVTAKILARVVRDLKPDIVLCGRQSTDGDTAQVPAELAEMLGFRFIPYAMDFALDEIQTRTGRYAVEMPCVVSVERIKELRFASYKSQKKEVKIIDNSVLGFEKNEVGEKGSPTRVLKSFLSEAGRRKCTFVSADDMEAIVKNALNKPFPVADAAFRQKDSKKIGRLLVVGEGLQGAAEDIAETVIRFNGAAVDEICGFIQRSGIKNVIFKSNLQNRAIAPAVAARLNAGLCADCIRLETDGEKLFAYRPAASGKIVAKIACEGELFMATVREAGETSGDIVFGIGYGANGYLPQIKAFAERIGAKLAASRKAVDNGLMPYETQIGLTGKIIKPKVYVAWGISGKIQHRTGMENSGTVIAINKDKNSEIFDYADYGIVEDIKNVGGFQKDP